MNVLLICTGNICRSPYAAALIRHQAVHSNLTVEVQSAGTKASSCHPMSLPMEIILQEQGVDPAHQSQGLTWDLMDWADLALTMTRPQKILLASQLPQFTAKLFTLKEYVGHTHEPDIDDPYGTDLGSYRQCAAEIETACDRLLKKLQSL
ncbi:MAG: low molecular weight protein arginine phosphatase [Cyanobacteria bacterium P01_H01_bin.119]